MSDPKKRILVIGGVAAGATAAARARRLDEDAEIVLVERGPYVSFANCGLPYHVSGAIDKRSKLLLQTPEGFLSRYRVQVLVRTEAIAIDRAARTVRVRDLSAEGGGAERDLPYDALVLALGGSPVVPPLPGAGLDHVFRLWTVPDMDAIQKRIASAAPKTALVVGGGFIGLEAAEAFAERGLSTTVVELSDHLLPPMDASVGALVKERFEAAGVRVLTSRAVKEIAEGYAVLDDGSRVDADLVLLSVGVRPNVVLAKAAGLEIGASGGLVVDDYLRTSDDRIWAAGDMLEIDSAVTGAKVRVPLAGPANRQGRIAATNALAALGGDAAPLKYRGAAGTAVVKVFDATAAMTGLSLAAARRAGLDAAEATVLKADHATYYPGGEDLFLSLVYDRTDGRVLGAQAFGRRGADKRIDAAAVAVKARLSVEDLAELDLAYAPPYSSANDPLNMAAFAAANARSGYSPLREAAAAAEDAAGDRAVLVDVRTYGEYAKGHAAAALHIPLDELRDRLGELPADRTPLLVSKGGYEGHVAARILRGRGRPDATNVSGGWAALRLVPGLAIEPKEGE